MSRHPGSVLFGLGVLAGVAALAIGTALLLRVESGFGTVWALLFVICGVVALGSGVLAHPRLATPLPPAREETWEGESAQFFPRRTGPPTAMASASLLLLGVWFVALGVVGYVEHHWVWPVLAVLPAVYFLGFVGLRLLGRFRPAGIWLTPTRVVDEHHGVRSELPLGDIGQLSTHTDALHLMPAEGTSVSHRRLAPQPWSARLPHDRLVIHAGEVEGGSAGLAAAVQRQLDTTRRG